MVRLRGIVLGVLTKISKVLTFLVFFLFSCFFGTTVNKPNVIGDSNSQITKNHPTKTRIGTIKFYGRKCNFKWCLNKMYRKYKRNNMAMKLPLPTFT